MAGSWQKSAAIPEHTRTVLMVRCVDSGGFQADSGAYPDTHSHFFYCFLFVVYSVKTNKQAWQEK